MTSEAEKILFSARMNLRTGEIQVGPRVVLHAVSEVREIDLTPGDVNEIISRAGVSPRMSPQEQFRAVEAFYTRALTPLVQVMRDDRISSEAGGWADAGVKSNLPADLLYTSACAFLFDVRELSLPEASKHILKEALRKGFSEEEIDGLVLPFSDVLQEYWPDTEVGESQSS